MSGEPTLNTMTKFKLASFAAEMMVKYPDKKDTILSLQETLETKLDKNPQLRDDIIQKLNADTKGTLNNARSMIEKDPKILDQVNNDPSKLAAMMGIEARPPQLVAAAAAPAAPQADSLASEKPAATQPVAQQNASLKPPASIAKPEPVARSQPEPVAVAAVTLSAEDRALREEIALTAQEITKMQGFEELAARADQDDGLNRAIDAIMGKDAEDPKKALETLKEVQKDPEFFVKANAMIDQIPEQSRDTAYNTIIENPATARKAIAGDKQAESELRTQVMFGGMAGLFSGGPDGMTGGLGSLMNGNFLKELVGMLEKFLPQIVKGLEQMLGKASETLKTGISKLQNSEGLLRSGNNPEGTRDLVTNIGKQMGVETGNKPVLDAANPDAAPVPVSQLGEPQVTKAIPQQTPSLEQRDPLLQQPGMVPGGMA